MGNSEEMRRKLESMEADIAKTSPSPQASATAQGNKSFLKPLAEAFNRLNTVAKVGAIAVGLMVGLAIISTVLKIVTSVIIVAVLLFAGYLGYKFVLAEESQGR